MADNSTDTSAPLTFAEQELRMVRVILQSRGWILTDAKEDARGITIVAHKPAAPQPLSMEALRQTS